MTFIKKIAFTFSLLLLFITSSKAQIVADTLIASRPADINNSVVASNKKIITKVIDSTYIKNPNARNPRVAALRSAIVPGLGQIYNRKHWYIKVPIVYAALGGTAWYFFYNLKYYKQYRLGYKVAIGINSPVSDSTGYNKIKDNYTKIAVDKNWQQELRYARDQVRKDVDYAAIYFLIAWALNVVEASVSAHLSTFDVSPNLSFKIQPGYSDLAKTNGISLVLKFK